MELQTKASLSFTIAATVVDIRPNGNLVVEAHQHVQDNEDIWDQSLSGLIRPQDVLPNNTVLSQNIAELMIDKKRSRPRARRLSPRLAHAALRSLLDFLEGSGSFFGHCRPEATLDVDAEKCA